MGRSGPRRPSTALVGGLSMGGDGCRRVFGLRRPATLLQPHRYVVCDGAVGAHGAEYSVFCTVQGGVP